MVEQLLITGAKFKGPAECVEGRVVVFQLLGEQACGAPQRRCSRFRVP